MNILYYNKQTIKLPETYDSERSYEEHYISIEKG